MARLEMTPSFEKESVLPVWSRSSRTAFLVVGALLVAVGVGWFSARHVSDGPSSGPAVAGQAVPAAVKCEIHLYFGDLQGRFLRAEQRVIDRPADDVAFGRQLVEALIDGPQKGGSRTLPEGVRLRAFFVTGGTAYVDFVSDAFVGHPGGVDTELLSIYAIVNTLVVNVETIREVKILIGGQERPTLAGHVDLQQNFMANMMWIR
jgi:hypothetical protein